MSRAFRTLMLICAAVAVAKSTDASAQTALSFGSAQHDAVKDLAHAALDQLADTVVEVQRPAETGPMIDPITDGHPVLIHLNFGARAKSAGEPGVCQADVISVDLEPTTTIDRFGMPVSKPAAVQVITKYRVVGPTEPLPDQWSRTYETKLNALCSAQRGAWDFFTAPGSVAAWHAARIVELARVRIRKTDAAWAEKIDTSRITSVEERPCDARDDSVTPLFCSVVGLGHSTVVTAFPELTIEVSFREVVGRTGHRDTLDIESFKWTPVKVWVD